MAQSHLFEPHKQNTAATIASRLTEMAFPPALVVLIATLTSVWLYCQIGWRRAEAADHAAVKILYVLECEGVPEWQAISAEYAAVSWVGDLKDRLTISSKRPHGEDVTVTTRKPALDTRLLSC